VSGEVRAAVPEPEWYRHPAGAPGREAWLRTLGRDLPVRQQKPYTVSSTIRDALSDSRLIRLMRRVYEKQQAKLYGRGTTEYNAMMTMAEESTFRAVQSGLGLKGHAAQALADLAGHKPIRAIYNLLR
jgi:hypothetical protein